MEINKSELYGGMTTDYFAFFCPKCGSEINNGVVIEDGPAIYRGMAECPNCEEKFKFKLLKNHQIIYENSLKSNK